MIDKMVSKPWEVYCKRNQDISVPEQRRQMVNWCYERWGDDSKGKNWDTSYDIVNTSNKYTLVWVFATQEDAVEFSLTWT